MADNTSQLILAKLDEVANAIGALSERIDALAALPPNPDEPDAYLTVAEAAAEFKISKTVLYRLKHIQCRRGRTVRFKRSALANHMRPKPLKRGQR